MNSTANTWGDTKLNNELPTPEEIVRKLETLIPKTLEQIRMSKTDNYHVCIRQEAVRFAVNSGPGGYLGEPGTDLLLRRSQAIYEFLTGSKDTAIVAAAKELAKTVNVSGS